MHIKTKKNRVVLILLLVLMLLGMLFMMLYQANCKSRVNIKHRLQWWRTEIGAEDVSQKAAGRGVKIAILDTGIDSTHPDLSLAKVKEIKIDGVEGQNDDRAHGTAIAGIIVAYPHNSEGVLGVASEAELISIDITDSEYAEPKNIVAGIELALEEGADIISISLGLKEDNENVHQAIKMAHEKGVVIVASAGNYMSDDVLYPAKYDEVICVGALSKKGEIISPKGNIEKRVIYLPGENVVTTCSGDRLYVGATGTSFSTAILSGLVALMLEMSPDITNQELYTYFETLPVGSEITIGNCLEFAKRKEK